MENSSRCPADQRIRHAPKSCSQRKCGLARWSSVSGCGNIRLGRPAGPVIGVLLPRWPVGRNSTSDPTFERVLSCKGESHNPLSASSIRSLAQSTRTDLIAGRSNCRRRPAKSCGSKRLSIWRDFCFSRMSMAQTPVELACIGRLRLATGHAGDLR